jgi:hypothetical protein
LVVLSHDAQPCHLGLVRYARQGIRLLLLQCLSNYSCTARVCAFSLSLSHTLSLSRSYSVTIFLLVRFLVASRRFVRSSSLCSRGLHTLWKYCAHVLSAHNTSWLLALTLALDSARKTYSNLGSRSSQATEGARHEARRDEIELLGETSNMHPGVRRPIYHSI